MSDEIRSGRRRGGSAMVMSMFAVVVLIVVGISLLRLALGARITAIRGAEAIAARSAADAGLVKALHEMNEKLGESPWDNETLPSAVDVALEGCQGTYSFAVTGEPSSGFTIVCTGVSGGIEKTVQCELESLGAPLDLLTVRQDIILQNNCEVSAWDSRTGEAATYPLRIGTLASEGAEISMSNNTRVEGDVYVGVDGDPDEMISTSNNTEITGSTYALTTEMEMPVIAPPSLPNKGDISPSGDLTIGPADSGQYGTIDIGNNKKMIVAGGDVVLYVTGDVELNNNSTIEVAEDASLTLYVEGDIISKNNAAFNNKTKVPLKCMLYGTSAGPQDFEFKNNADLYAFIVAPNADVVTNNNAGFYGACVAANFEAKNNAKIYFDVALAGEQIFESGGEFVIRYWSEE